MKKIAMLIMVLGLVLLWPVHMKSALCDSFACEDTTTTLLYDISIVVPSDCTPVCVVYLEIADVGRPGPVSSCALANITTQLPDTATIMLLGLGGLLYRRRKDRKE
jgi:hypothetical protein